MKRKLTLTEELNRMRGLMIYENGDYKNPIIKEVVEGSDLTFKKAINFAPGWYTHTDKEYTGSGYKWNLDNDLSEELNRIKEFLLNNPTGYIVDITMSAGESQIPNTDNTTKGGGKRVDPGYLSRERLNTIEVHIKNVLEEWKTEGIDTENIKIKKCYGKNCGENELDAVGPTNWVGQEFCPVNDKRKKDPDGYNCTTSYRKGKENKYKDLKQKYDEEQFLDVAMSVKKIEKEPEPEKEPEKEPKKEPIPIPFTPECVTGLEIKIGTAKHGCNNAEFFLFANNTLIKNVEGGDTHNGSNSVGVRRLKMKRLHHAALNPGYGKLHTKRYGIDGDLGNERSDIFKITNEQSKEITKENENGVINLFLICVFPYCHTGLQNVTITHPKIGEVFKGKIRASNSFLISLSPCGDKVGGRKLKEGIKMPTKGVINSAKNKWFKERRNISKALFKLEKAKNPNKKYKEDYKTIILDKLTIISNETRTVLNLIKNTVNEFNKSVESGTYSKTEKDWNKFIQKDESYTKAKDIIQNLNNKIIFRTLPTFRIDKSNDKNKFNVVGNETYNFTNKFLNKHELANDIRTQYPELLKIFYQVGNYNNIGRLSLNPSRIWDSFVNRSFTMKYPNQVVDLSGGEESVEI